VCKAVQGGRRKDKKVRTMHRHTEEVLYLLCFRSEGSSANQCSGSEKKNKSELCIGTAPALPFLFVCVKSKDSIYCVLWGSVEQSIAKARVGEQWTCQTSSGSSVLEPNLERSSDLEPNLERKLRFGAKPRAGAPFWSKIERERLRSANPRAGAHPKCSAKSDFLLLRLFASNC